jgi:DNA mismatch repair protein PMS2
MIKAIDKDSIHQICSSQVIVELCVAVKELVENSLDAGASLIEIKLSEHGTETIEVSDYACGIDPENYDTVALKHHTSKLSQFEDLATVSSFGFRGEALNALCEISGKLTIITKRENDELATALHFDRYGK